MVIKTKYDIGQHIYKYDGKNIHEYRVVTIFTGNNVREDDKDLFRQYGTFVRYRFQEVQSPYDELRDFEYRMEGVYFASPEELKKHVMNKFEEFKKGGER